MLSRKELEKRVSDRRQELDRDKAKLSELTDKLTAFVTDIRSRSVIFNLLKALPVWTELERILPTGDNTTE